MKAGDKVKVNGPEGEIIGTIVKVKLAPVWPSYLVEYSVGKGVCRRFFQGKQLKRVKIE